MAKSSTTFQKGQSGNPAGKRQGSRNRASLAVEALLAGEAEKLTRQAVDLALGGDVQALRICLDRISPPRRDRHVTFTMPEIAKAEDLPRATNAILTGVAAGDLTPAEGAELGKLVDAHVRAIEATDLHQRLSRLERSQT